MPAVSKKNRKLLASNANKQNKSNDESPNVISGQLQKQINNKKAKRKQKSYKKGIVFVKNLPHGFFEEQLRSYFEQFGKVTRIRLARSRHTGNSKSFAYIEFAVPDVAKIAAETMDNYLMFQKIVKAAYIPPEEQKYDYFRTKVRKVLNNAGKEIFISRKTQHKANEMKVYNNWTDEVLQKRNLSNSKKLHKLKKKYAHLNIDFDKLTMGLETAINSNGSAVEDDEEECVKNDSDTSEVSQNHSEVESTNTSNEVNVEGNVSESSESSSENSESPKRGSLLLIKKRKKSSSSSSINLNEKKCNNDSNKMNKKSKKINPTISQNKLLKNEKEHLEGLSDESSSSESSNEEDELNENENNLISIKKQKNIGKAKEEQKLKRNAPSGGIQKAKNKQLKNKNEKNKFSGKLKKSLIEATFKEMNGGNKKNELIKITKGTGKKIKK